eukprot:879685-Rhodomonas_salina.2
MVVSATRGGAESSWALSTICICIICALLSLVSVAADYSSIHAPSAFLSPRLLAHRNHFKPAISKPPAGRKTSLSRVVMREPQLIVTNAAASPASFLSDTENLTFEQLVSDGTVKDFGGPFTIHVDGSYPRMALESTGTLPVPWENAISDSVKAFQQAADEKGLQLLSVFVGGGAARGKVIDGRSKLKMWGYLAPTGRPPAPARVASSTF